MKTRNTPANQTVASETQRHSTVIPGLEHPKGAKDQPLSVLKEYAMAVTRKEEPPKVTAEDARKTNRSEKKPTMHAQVKRLFEAAYVLKGIEKQAEITVALHCTERTLRNWVIKGMPPGIIQRAARVLGCSSQWLTSGEGNMVPESDRKSSIDKTPQEPEFHTAEDEQQRRILPFPR